MGPNLKTSHTMSAYKTQFEEQGFCHVDGLFAEPELNEIEDFFEEYKRNGGAVFDAGSTYEEIDPGKRQVRAMHPHRYSEQAKAWFLNPRVMDVLAELLGKEAFGAQTMYYYKPPGAKGQGMHQDNFYLLSKPANCIAAWTPGSISCSPSRSGPGMLPSLPGGNSTGRPSRGSAACASTSSPGTRPRLTPRSSAFVP
jgi:hypothetical protein